MTIHPSALPEQRKPLCFLIAFRLPHATPPSGLPVELFLQAKGGLPAIQWCYFSFREGV